MPLLILAFLFYLVGTIGVIIENAGEFWLWFLAFGLVLDHTLLLLAVTGLKGLEFIRKVDFRGKISHILALVLAETGIWLRLKAETTFEELELDSLDLVDMAMACEDTFGKTVEVDENLKTVGDLAKILDAA